ncbi:NAD(P)-binding protein [Choiromyces venosus 120613-1]|uniref:NAD(P)-binding protein n=1 Tax=Choiromyces venosus 120613-1 TaxID=1336337 RepID=A0A3N4JR98_9PEZI|nr:NAD(P)-binding protein [Choiromyces venosus 120613-1]
MSSILVTGATGGLGRQTLEFLAKYAPPGTTLLATTRDTSKIPENLKGAGANITFRQADFDDPIDKLAEAFRGADKLLVIATNSLDHGKRVSQVCNAIDAAAKAGVGRVYYTSFSMGGWADESVCGLQKAHYACEGRLKSCGADYTIIREGIYLDAFTMLLGWKPDSKEVYIPFDGPIHFSPRRELAEGTARLLLSSSHKNSTALFTGPYTITFSRLVELINEVMETNAEFKIVGLEPYVKGLVANGQSEEFAKWWSSFFVAVGNGETETTDGLLEELLGRKRVDTVEYVRGILKETKETGGYVWADVVKS